MFSLGGTSKDLTVDGHAATQITSDTTGEDFVLDYLFVQGSSGQVYVVIFAGPTKTAAATEAQIFGSIKIA